MTQDEKVLLPIKMTRQERDAIHYFSREHGFASTSEFVRHAVSIEMQKNIDAREVGAQRAQRMNNE